MANPLEQSAKLLDAETRVTHDSAERERIDGVVARDGQDPGAVRHDYVLALANDGEAGLL